MRILDWPSLISLFSPSVEHVLPYFLSLSLSLRPFLLPFSDLQAEVYAVETLQNMRAVTVLGLERRRYSIYAEMLESWHRQKKRKICVNSLCFALDYGFFGKITSLTVLIWGIWLLQRCTEGIELSNVYTSSIGEKNVRFRSI